MAFGTIQAAKVGNGQTFVGDGLLEGLGISMNLLVIAIVQVNLGLAVAINAPTHGELTVLVDLCHFFNGSVTGLALDTGYFVMLVVIEISEIRQIVNAHPFDRGVGFVGR